MGPSEAVPTRAPKRSVANPARRANQAEAVKPGNEKYSAFQNTQIRSITLSARATMRDVRAIVTERGAGCDGRLLRQRGASRAGENAAAYGEVVWSWRRDPGVYPSRPCGNGNGGNKGRSPGRARRKP